MISSDFAPNESWDDAWLSLKLLFQPWRWEDGKERKEVKTEVLKLFHPSTLHVSLFLSGRSALYYLLKSLNLPENSEVLIQAFTCEAVVFPILANKLRPNYIDIEPDTYSIDYQKLTNQLSKNSKVLILQHTFGFTPKYRNQILDFAKKNELVVIEDLAHGFDLKIFQGVEVKNLKSHFYLLSFGRSKAFSSVFGGAILTRNQQQVNELTNNFPFPSYLFIIRCLLYKPLVMLVKSTYELGIGKLIHKILKTFNLLIPEVTQKEKRGNYDEIFNKSYPNGLAILILNQLKKFDQMNRNRSTSIQIFNSTFSKKMPDFLIRYPLLVDNRKDILAKTAEQNIYLGKWYDQVVAPKDIDLERVEYKKGSCPTAENLCQKIINLPTNISEEEAKRVLDILNDVK
ncbi:DegT/DnrJ/EryC1/StrS aminotransferase family protein [Candidatus Roizmanbacteria bacterium]|nr:DegT/DnrJ/EryC1/StrS aminotransferase family protein [Candidatus Roizmanbacteria bacterium]